MCKLHDKFFLLGEEVLTILETHPQLKFLSDSELQKPNPIVTESKGYKCPSLEDSNFSPKLIKVTFNKV